MLASEVVTTVDSAIERAQRYLLQQQQPDGHWVGELEADTTITSEYLLFSHLIDRANPERDDYIRAADRRVARRLAILVRPDGNLGDGDESPGDRR